MVLLNSSKLILWKKKSFKKLTISTKNKAGRNSFGYLTLLNRGKVLHKRRYRLVDFYRNISHWLPFIILRIEYDPLRTSWLALLLNFGYGYSYILASRNMKLGAYFYFLNKFDLFFIVNKNNLKLKQFLNFNINGLFLPIKFFPLGLSIYGLELYPKLGIKYIRAAGTSAQLFRKTFKYITIKLPSGEIRLFNVLCNASIGIISNREKFMFKLTKAGQSRYLGFKSVVRGVAKNPIDHSHGGGQGHTSPPASPRNPWGKLTKDIRTSNTKHNRFLVKTKRGIWLSNKG